MSLSNYLNNVYQQTADEGYFDFARCQRDDGTIYASPTDTCRKGKRIDGDAPKGEKAPKSASKKMQLTAKIKAMSAADLKKVAADSRLSDRQKRTLNRLIKAKEAEEGQNPAAAKPKKVKTKAPNPPVKEQQSSNRKEVLDEVRKEVGSSLDAAHEKIFEDRYAKARTVKELGSIHRKAIKDLDNDDLDAKEGVLIAMKKAMTDYLEANMASGQGAKRAAELAAMSPEERRRAETRDAIERGIKNKVVSGRR